MIPDSVGLVVMVVGGAMFVRAHRNNSGPMLIWSVVVGLAGLYLLLWNTEL